MLLAMFDEAKANRCGESSGYVIAYDFIGNKIIIKHWRSSPAQRPLEDAWFKAPPNDGVSWIGSPKDLSNRIITRHGLNKESSKYGYALVTRFLAGRWLLEHFGPLALPQV